MILEEALVLFRKLVDETGNVMAICPNNSYNGIDYVEVWDIVDLFAKGLYTDAEDKYIVSSDADLVVAIQKAAHVLDAAYLLGNQNDVA